MEVGPTVELFNCELCNKAFVSQNYLETHVILKHSVKHDHKCDVCGEYFTCKRTMERHKLRHSSVKKHECEACKETFVDELALSDHTSTHHLNSDIVEPLIRDNKKRFQCSLCEKSFVNTHVLKDHMVIHTGVKKHQCDTCGCYFSRKSTVERHVRLRHCKLTAKGPTQDNMPTDSVLRKRDATASKTLPKKFNCALCEKSFPRKSKLEDHMVVHTGEKKHQCDICGRHFALKGTMQRHMRVHRTSTTKSSAQDNITANSVPTIKTVYGPDTTASKTPQKKFNCTLCEKSFHRKHKLEDHMAVHTGEKRHQCAICGRHFSQKCSLQRHVRSRCKSITKSSTQDNMHTASKIPSLTTHMLSHTHPLYRHQCGICGRVFKHRSSVTRHKLFHTGEKNYKCDVCGKSFTYKRDVKKHMSIHHGSSKEAFNSKDNHVLTDASDCLTQLSTSTQPVLINEKQPEQVTDADPDNESSQDNLCEISVASELCPTPEADLLTNETTLSAPISQEESEQVVGNHPVTTSLKDDDRELSGVEEHHEASQQKEDNLQVLRVYSLEQHITPTLQISIKQENTDSECRLDANPITQRFPCNVSEKAFADKENRDCNMTTHNDSRGIKREVTEETFTDNNRLGNLTSTHSDQSNLCFESQVGVEVSPNGGDSFSRQMSTHNYPNSIKSEVCDEGFTHEDSPEGQAPHSDHKDITCNFECHICGEIFETKNSLGHISAHNNCRYRGEDNFHRLQSNHSASSRTLECGFCGWAFIQLDELTDHLLQHNGARLKLRNRCRRLWDDN